MKVEVTFGRGSTATLLLSQSTVTQIGSTPNTAPGGKSVEEEMKEYLSRYLALLEVAFSAPEPLRRNLLGILRTGTDLTASELIRQAIRFQSW